MIDKISDVKMSVRSPLVVSVKVTKEFGITSHIDLQKIMAEVTRLKPTIFDGTGRFIRKIMRVFFEFQLVRNNRNAIRV